MLCISRNSGEVFVLIDDREDEPLAVVSVVDIQGPKCRLGINAPQHIKILRKEVYDRSKGEPNPRATMTAAEINGFFNQ